MKHNNYAVLLISIFIFSSCATSYNVVSDYEKGINFSKYQTYYIINPEDGFPIGASPINGQRIERAIESELIEMNMKRNQHPDLVVSWTVNLKEVELTKMNYHFYGSWNSISEIQRRSFLEGTLTIDLIDVEKRQVIWHGKTSDHVYEGMPKIEDKINLAVHSIFNKYRSDISDQQSIVMQ